jgi:hypothetical protein
MKEVNTARLKEAIQKLPTYEPPAGLWADIESALEADAHVSEAVQHLPQYAPPALIWDQIETQLNLENRHKKPAFRILTFTPAQLLSAAASVAVLVAATWWMTVPVAPSEPVMAITTPAPTIENNIPSVTTPILQRTPIKKKTSGTPKSNENVPQTTENISWANTVVDDQLLEICREKEDEAFELVQNLCQNEVPVCEIPDFKSLKTELDELTIARNQLKEALGQFADDPDMVAQMVQIERERSEILQKLIAMI